MNIKKGTKKIQITKKMRGNCNKRRMEVFESKYGQSSIGNSSIHSNNKHK